MASAGAAKVKTAAIVIAALLALTITPLHVEAFGPPAPGPPAGLCTSLGEIPAFCECSPSHAYGTSTRMPPWPFLAAPDDPHTHVRAHAHTRAAGARQCTGDPPRARAHAVRCAGADVKCETNILGVGFDATFNFEPCDAKDPHIHVSDCNSVDHTKASHMYTPASQLALCALTRPRVTPRDRHLITLVRRGALLTQRGRWISRGRRSPSGASTLAQVVVDLSGSQV